MELLLDLHSVRSLAGGTSNLFKHPLLSTSGHFVHLKWPALLEYVGLGSLFSKLAPFDPFSPLYIATQKTLAATKEKEVVFYVFDRLFTESLNQIQALPEINPHFLLESIRGRKENPPSPEIDQALSASLTLFEARIQRNPKDLMHDLILYLAFDRMCIWLSKLFSDPTREPDFIQSLAALKESLIDSYQHIFKQAKTTPGMFRMVEALFAYEMREENIQKHPEADWTLLSQSIPALTQETAFSDSYIDDSATLAEGSLDDDEKCYIIQEPPELFQRRLRLTEWMAAKIKSEWPAWEIVLQPKKVLFV